MNSRKQKDKYELKFENATQQIRVDERFLVFSLSSIFRTYFFLIEVGFFLSIFVYGFHLFLVFCLK